MPTQLAGQRGGGERLTRDRVNFTRLKIDLLVTRYISKLVWYENYKDAQSTYSGLGLTPLPVVYL
jgi:hypothetical protein